MPNFIETKTKAPKVHLSSKISERIKLELEHEATAKELTLSNYISYLLENRHLSQRGIPIPKLIKQNEEIRMINDMLALNVEELEGQIEGYLDVLKDEPDERNLRILELEEELHFQEVTNEALQSYTEDIEEENETLKNKIKQLEEALRVVSDLD